MSHAAATSSQDSGASAPRWSLDPVLMMFAALAIAVAITWLVPSGTYQRDAKGLVIPGTFHQLEKPLGLDGLLRPQAGSAVAHPAGLAALVTAIPAGMVRSANVIAMLLFMGGMFGVLRATGALEAAIARLVAMSGGRTLLVVPIMMITLSAGSTFLGLVSEYLLVIPMMLTLSRAMGRTPMFGFAMLTVATKIGYLASVTNPAALFVAQPIVGVPVFSGFGFRFVLWAVFLTIGMVFVLRLGRQRDGSAPAHSVPLLTGTQRAIMLVFAGGVTLLVCGSVLLHWQFTEFSAVYISLAIAIAATARMRPTRAVHHFLEGMKLTVIAGLLLGMAVGVEIVLREAQVFDTIIHGLAHQAEGLPPILVGQAMMLIEMVLTLLIPSTSAKAALSMPILGPIASMSDVSGQTTVLAFLLGNGLVNAISPTSGMLLAFLATAGIRYSDWLRFVAPLILLLTALSFIVIVIAVKTGY